MSDKQPSKIFTKLQAKRVTLVNPNKVIELDKTPDFNGHIDYHYYSAGGQGAKLAALLLDEDPVYIRIRAVNTQGHSHNCSMPIPKSNIEEFCNKLMALR